MKKIFSILLAGLTFFGALSCVDEIEPVIEEYELGRCLAPTNLSAKVQDGEYVLLDWDKAKASGRFIVELFTNEQMTGDPVMTIKIKKEEMPYLAHLEADMIYYFRVKAQDLECRLEDSKWSVYDKDIQTSAIKSSLNPEIADRSPESITLKWTADPEVDHIRIVPALDGKSEYTRFDVSGSQASAGQAVVTGLSASSYYSFTVHFKSADRGSASAWTRPNTEGFTKVTNTESFKKALEDGATQILLAYNEEPYMMGAIKAKGDFAVKGESTVDGLKPVIVGAFSQDPALASFSIEDIALDGSAQGEFAQQTHVFTISAACSLEKVSMVNVDISEFQRGIYYDNFGASVSGTILFDGLNASYITGSGGDCIDLRNTCTVGNIIIRNSTFNHGTRTVLRADNKVTVSGSYIVEHNTFNAMCHESGNAIGGGNVQGILAMRAACNYVVQNNLFLNNDCWLVGANTGNLVPTFTKNYYYNCVPEFFTSAKTDGTGARTDMSEAVAVANGGLILEKDPCVDSEGEKFYVTNAAVIENKVGDPRWFQTYVEIPEDLTQAVTDPIKTWDFSNGKVFYKQADKDMVRDGIRFYVKNNPVVFAAEGFQFTAAATLVEGVPADCGLGFKINRAGSVVVSTAANGDPSALLTLALDGKPVIGVPVDTQNYQYTFPDLADGEEHMIYIYGTAPIALTFLQWNDNTETDGPKILGTPALVLDKASVARGEVVTASWEAVDKAGAYEITVNGKTQKIAETTYAIETAALKDWKYLVSVKAVPADDDMIRQESETVTTAFKIEEAGVNTVSKDKVWDAAFFEKLDFAYNTDDQGNPVDATAIAGNAYHNDMAFMSNGKVKFGKFNDIPVVQTGGAVTYGTKACLQIKVGGNGTLTLKYGSTGDAGRFLKVANGTTAITEGVYEAPAKAEAPAVTELKVSAVDGDVINIGGSGNLYFYEIAWAPSGAVEKTLTWDFSSAAWTAKFAEYTNNTNYTDWDFTVDGLQVVSGGASMKYVSGDKYCIQPGGKSNGTTQRYFKFVAPADGKLTVWATNTGSSEDLTRMVTVKNAGAEESKAGGYATTGGPVAVDFDVKAGEVMVYPTGNGLRFYKLELVYTETAAPIVEDYVWDFSSEQWQAVLSPMGESKKDISATWDLTVDGLHYYALKSRWDTKYIQVTQGNIENGVFTFTAKGPGYVYVEATNTGSSDADRNVCVQNGNDASTLQKLKGGVPSSGDHANLEFAVDAGEIKVFTDNALRIYKIEFHTAKK